MRVPTACSASIPALMALLVAVVPSGLGAGITLVPPGTAAEIDAHDECRLVRNNNAAGLMVPHRFATEWVSGGASFLENTPANVVVSPCPGGALDCEGTIRRAGFNPVNSSEIGESHAHLITVGNANGWCGGNANDNSTTYTDGQRTTWAEWSAKYPNSIDSNSGGFPFRQFIWQNACVDMYASDLNATGFAYFVPDGCPAPSAGTSIGHWMNNENFPCECEAPPAVADCEGEIIVAYLSPGGFGGQGQLVVHHASAAYQLNGRCGNNPGNSPTYTNGQRTTWSEWTAKYPEDGGHLSPPLLPFVHQHPCLDIYVDSINQAAIAFFRPDGFSGDPPWRCEQSSPPGSTGVGESTQICGIGGGWTGVQACCDHVENVFGSVVPLMVASSQIPSTLDQICVNDHSPGETFGACWYPLGVGETPSNGVGLSVTCQ